MINAWNILSILPVGKSANSFQLPTNCYYCTAAALQNMDCKDLVSQSEYMQNDTGTVEDFIQLFTIRINYNEFSRFQEVNNFLLTRLPNQHAIAFGFSRLNGTGHMLVVFKANILIDNQGIATNPGWGNLRHIDYQDNNPQPVDGLLPKSENQALMSKFYVFHP